jgi:glycosyltransferase involved in cell wall biosynthesis
MPYFSVVIPTFNSGSTIGEALNSLLKQKFSDFEVIIVDGLSSDDTVLNVKSYGESGLQYQFVSEKDKGVYDAMNKGISQATGQWLYFMGSDDSLFDPDVLKNVYESISNQKFGKVYYGDVVISGDTSWAHDGEVYDGQFSLQKLISKNICHQSVFYNGEFIKKEIGLFNIKYPICADWDFNFRCWSKTEFIYMDLKIANFSAGGESTKYREDLNFTEDMVPNILSYFKISPFSRLVNYPLFPQYGKLLEMQKKRSYPHYIFDRIKEKMIRH